jgi:very-short-patch-repair endonuclease
MPKYRVEKLKRSQARHLRHALTDAKQRLWFLILRFWNNDILGNTDSVLQQILETIEQSLSPRGLRPRPSPTRGED